MSHSEKIQPPAIGSVIPTGSPDFLPERNDRSGKKLWVKLKNNYTPAQNSTPGSRAAAIFRALRSKSKATVRTTGRCSIEEACKGVVDGVGEARLCLPTPRHTFFSSLLMSCFIFIGLLALSAAEVGLLGLPKWPWITLVLRVVGWAFLFYIPIHLIAVPFTRNFVLWALEPGESLSEVGLSERPARCQKRATLLPYATHACWILVYALVICISIGEENLGHFGFIPIYALGNVLMMPVGIFFTLLLAPPTVSRRYAFRIGPATILFPIIGFLVMVSSYILLRRLSGPWLGFLMPPLLSTYELLGTSLVSKFFTKEYVTQWEVRQGYAGTNQGLVVSIAICNLHAMAEGARLTFLYVDYLENQDWSIVVPILTGVLWNVLARFGTLDRVLHIITCGWRKPNNGSKLLRESGYCMGYLRFGAMGALFLVRLCIGAPWAWDGPEVTLMAGMLLAEILEDLMSYAMWRAGLDISPAPYLVTEQEVQDIATIVLNKRKASKEKSRTLSTEQADVQSTKDRPVPGAPSAGSTEDPETAGAAGAVPSERKLMKSTCWRLRVAYDFRFRIEAFDQMPFWGHLLPAAMAQFHTIFAMLIFSNGLDYILGVCKEVDFTGYESAVLWWPIVAEDRLCHAQKHLDSANDGDHLRQCLFGPGTLKGHQWFQLPFTWEVSQQWPTGEVIVPRCLLPDYSDPSLAPQILDFYPKVGVAGETVLVEIIGRRFPHILPAENKSVVECNLGGDGYRAPAVLLSDKRALCNLTSSVAGSKKLGLIFANVLQAFAKKKITFGRVAAPTLQVTTILAEDVSEECKDTQVFCQPPAPEPALSEVPTQRSFDPQVISTQSSIDTVENLYSIWEVVSVVPDVLPLSDSAYVITFSVPPENGLACRLYPDGEQVFASQLTNTSIMCRTAIGAPGSYSLQVAEAPDFHFLTLPLMIEVFEQPQILHLSPAQVYPGQGWTLFLLATQFPEQRMAVASFRCKVGSQLVVGEVSTSRVASCTLSAADVEAIGPGDHAVEVLVDGLHESRSEPRVMLKVFPEMAQVDTLSSDSMSALPRGDRLLVTGRRLPQDGGCILGEDIPEEGVTAAYAAATFHNDTMISCTIPQEAMLGTLRFRLSIAGQPLLVQTTSKMSLIVSDRPLQQDIPSDTACAGGTCRLSWRYLPEAQYFRMTGLLGHPENYAQRLPSILLDLRSVYFAPREAFAESVPLRFGGEGLLDYARLFPASFSCQIEQVRVPAQFVREDRWPFLCDVDLSSLKGLEVRAQLVFTNAGIDENIGPAFNLRLLLRPRVLEVSPTQAVLGLATPLALHLAVAPPKGALLRCHFGRLGSSPAFAVGRSVHCRSPTVDAVARVELQLQVALEQTEVNLTQRIWVTAQEDFRFEVPPERPVLAVMPPFTAPVGAALFLEWKSHSPIFEVLGRIPYRCSWRQTEIGELSTPLLALTPELGHCRVPLASTPHATAVRLEDPSGQVVMDAPLFRYFSPLRGSWWLPGGAIRPGQILRFQTNEEAYPAMAYGQPQPGVVIHCQFGHVRKEPRKMDVNGVECEIPSIAPGNYLLSLLYDEKHILNSVPMQLDPPKYASATGAPNLSSEEILLSTASPAVQQAPPLDPDREPLPVPAVPLLDLKPSTTLIVVKAFSPSRGSLRGGTTVRLTVRIPEDSEEPYALWCVFGDHPPSQAIRPDLSGRAWHDKLEADRQQMSTSLWMDLLCISPEHPVAESVPMYITRSSDFQPGSAPDGSRMFTYTPHPDMITITPALVTHHFQRDQQVTIHIRANRGQAVPLSTLNDALDCALLSLETATTTGDWTCLESNESNSSSCQSQTVGDIYDALGTVASGMKISGYAASTAGILSQGSKLADGNGLAAVPRR
ncbi:Uncharacterized protein SCF082_LOCUS22361 [Durusdinium trenchii]|uniref:Uncharacterized protein n=1 Tax=Durusdinium trenchii TaxID=1381693 RepID=A0ABP0LHW1_9DINO